MYTFTNFRRGELLNLKKGEEQKTKAYCCLCVMKKKCDIDDLRQKLPETPLVIQQKTPIRVLHRRTVATRPKTIHTLSVESVNTAPPEGKPRVLFCKLQSAQIWTSTKILDFLISALFRFRQVVQFSN